MLSIDISHAASFLSLPYEAALRPRLERAAGWLQNGGGKGSDFIGWVTLPRDYDKDEYARILAAAKKIQGDSKALVVIGIGGSYLGARGVIECLCSPNYNLKKKSTPNIYFIGNGLSSDALREVTELIGDDDFSVNVISKSGTTTEPAVAFRFFREKLEKKYGKAEAAKRIYATTDAHKGALKSLADQEGYEEFVVPDNIGGRYSVLTAVGLLPIAVAGVDLDGENRLYDPFDIYIFQELVACRFTDDQVFRFGTEFPATGGGDPDIDEKSYECGSSGDMPAVAVINGFLCNRFIHYDL